VTESLNMFMNMSCEGQSISICLWILPLFIVVSLNFLLLWPLYVTVSLNMFMNMTTVCDRVSQSVYEYDHCLWLCLSIFYYYDHCMWQSLSICLLIWPLYVTVSLNLFINMTTVCDSISHYVYEYDLCGTVSLNLFMNMTTVCVMSLNLLMNMTTVCTSVSQSDTEHSHCV
jgi:hypothetical protein